MSVVSIEILGDTRVGTHRYLVGRRPSGRRRGSYALYVARDGKIFARHELVVDARHARFFAKDGRNTIGVDGIKALARLSRKVLGPAPEA